MEFQDFQLHPRAADVMGRAQTGTGKTAAFALPILSRLMNGNRRHIRALIIAPTRELAEQINDSISVLGRKTGLKSVTVYGGVSIKPQIDKIGRGVEVVVACPGRLLDLIKQGFVDLSTVEVLVLDEADHMFDMGFLPDIRKIIKQLPIKRQTLLFSATMPDDIRRLAQDVLRTPVTVQVDQIAPAETVSHALFPVSQHLKTSLLMELLRHTDTGPVLIFTRTKHRAKRLGQQLEKAGYRAASLQGNLSQNKRQAALDGFKKGVYQILVATDIAARGIDVSDISHVINYDIPDTVDAYTHRIGRTGRAAKTGDAFTFITSEDEDTVRSIERVLGEKIERRFQKDFDYKAAAPAKDKEFARPSRQPQRRPEHKRPEQAGAHASAAYKQQAPAVNKGERKQSDAAPGKAKGPAGAAPKKWSRWSKPGPRSKKY